MGSSLFPFQVSTWSGQRVDERNGVRRAGGELRDEAEPVGDAHVAGTDATAIPLAGPWVTEREVAAVAHAARHSWFEHGYDENDCFEKEFAAATGRAHAIALPSCTSALHLSLMALGIGPGDEVIVPETTWIATAAPISYVGATPIFVDIDSETWCLSVDAVREALTERTRAIIAVDLYGGFPQAGRIGGLGGRIRHTPHRGLGTSRRRLARPQAGGFVRHHIYVQFPRFEDIDHRRRRNGSVRRRRCVATDVVPPRSRPPARRCDIPQCRGGVEVRK